MRWAGQLQLRNVKPLGQGGHGKVFAATLECGGGITESVVLKLPHGGTAAELLQSRDFLLEEARLVAKLCHPNIIGFRDFNEVVGDDGVRTPCLMLEHGGIALSDLLRAHGGRLEPGLAAFIAVGVLSGLAHAHARDTIHRDIKPSNVVIGTHGEVKLIDFGIAKAEDSTNPTTKVGVLKGTTLYVSPEAYLGKRLDGRADLWSVGILLYEMLIGRYPWYVNRSDYPNAMVYATRVATAVETLPLPELPTELVPEPLAAVVRTLTQKSRDDRYESAVATIAALERVVSTFISPWAAARELGQQAVAGASPRVPSVRPVAPDSATFDVKSPPPPEELVSMVIPAAVSGGVELPSGLFESDVMPMHESLDASEITEQVPMPPPRRPAPRRALVGGGLAAAAALVLAAGVGLARRSASPELAAPPQVTEAPPVPGGADTASPRPPAVPPPERVAEPEVNPPSAPPATLSPSPEAQVTARAGDAVEPPATEPPAGGPAGDVLGSSRTPSTGDATVGSPPVDGEGAGLPVARVRGGALDVVVEPRGAFVSLDGKPPVHAPVKFEDVRAGTHVLRFGLAAGELGHERKVRVRPGQASPVLVKLANPFDEQG